MNQEIRSKLDLITNALFAGGVDNPITCLEQISYLIFLKLLDEEESRRELKGSLISKGGDNGQSLYPGQASRYRWSSWRFKSGNDLRDFIRDDVFPYLASLVKEEAQVAIYFEDARLEVEDPNVLKQVIDAIDGIEFLKPGADVKGDIYEYLLTYLNTIGGALLGQFRTPRQIRLAMVEMLDPDLGDAIFDPASGTGGFLIDAVEHILAKYSATPREVPIYGEAWLEKRGLTIAEAKRQIPNLQTFPKGAGERIPDWNVLENAIYGIEVSRQMMRVSMMNLVLHGIRHANVKCANALSQTGGLTEDDLRRKYKVILSTPPFAGVLPKESVRLDLPTQSKKSELLFLGLMMETLAPGGRCAVIVPEGLLFGSTTSHVDLRRQLVQNYDLQAVISLPVGVFKPSAGVKTGILIFRKPVDAGASTKRVWFYQVNNDGYDPEKIIGGGRPETPQENHIPDLLRQWESYRKSGFEKPPGFEGGKILPAGTEQPTCWWVSASVISENDFNLAGGRYKPQCGEKPPEEDPAELINKTLKLEQEISTRLKTLLKEVGKIE